MLNNSTIGFASEKTIKFGSWNELKRAISKYEKLGYECEVRGWEDMQNNKLTIRDALKKEVDT